MSTLNFRYEPQNSHLLHSFAAMLAKTGCLLLTFYYQMTFSLL